jgi:hypothetical protein
MLFGEWIRSPCRRPMRQARAHADFSADEALGGPPARNKARVDSAHTPTAVALAPRIARLPLYSLLGIVTHP